MKNFAVTYKHSLKHLSKNYTTWIFFGFMLVINTLMSLVIPSLANGQAPIIFSFLPTIFILSAFYSSMLAEGNGNRDERTFVLSRPVRRDTYLLAKYASSLTYTLILAILSYLEWAISEAINHNIFTECGNMKIGAEIGMLFSFISLCFFGTIFGTTFRYYLKEKISSMIVLIVVLLFAVICPVAAGATTHGEEVPLLVTLYCAVLPTIIFLPLGIASVFIGIKLMNKTDVGV